MKKICGIVLLICLLRSAKASEFPVEKVSNEQAAAWIRWVTPLPKSIQIDSKVMVHPGYIVVSYEEPADPLVTQAAKELKEAIGPMVGTTASGLKKLTIRLQLGGADAEALRELKNCEQAYLIQPDGGGLRLIALTPTGLYYASKTLKQLISAEARPELIVMPLVTAKDWPDLEARGLWGADTQAWIPWMSDHKLNLISHISRLEVDKQGRGHAGNKPGREALNTEAPSRAVANAPVILHLEQVGGKGVFDAYPNLRAKGGKEGTICYSQTEIVDILTDWMVDLASLPGVKTVNQWLAENLGGQGGCQCENCKKHDRNVLEAQVVLAAYEKAKQRKPGLRLTLSTSEEIVPSLKQVLEIVPEDVGVWYYHSLLTYCTSHNPMVDPRIEEFARRGRWAGVVPSLGANVNFPGPFTCPQFVHARMNEFVDKKMSGVLGYPSPGIVLMKCNVEAMAEWAWNAKGRSPREFAVSYATREGLPDPELFADWCEANGSVAWDVYGSCWPEYQRRKNPIPVATALKERTLPTLQEANKSPFRGPWGDFKSEEQFSQDVMLAEKAVSLAEKLGVPQFKYETVTVRGYINSLNALWELNKIVTPKGITMSDRGKGKELFTTFLQGLDQARAALPKWVKSVRPVGDPNDVISEPLKVIDKLRNTMRKTAEDLGVKPV